MRLYRVQFREDRLSSLSKVGNLVTKYKHRVKPFVIEVLYCTVTYRLERLASNAEITGSSLVRDIYTV